MHYINPPENPPKNTFHRTMHSRILDHEIGYNIYLPPDYAHSLERFPVCFHLHGWTGSESSEIHAMESVCRSRRAITVFPNSSPVIEDREYLPVESYIVEELVPFIDREYRTIASREGRTLSGFSMGGGAAFVYAAKHTDLFCGVTAYAGTYHHYFEQGFVTVGADPAKAAELRDMILTAPECTQNNVLSLLNRNADLIRSSLRIELRVGTEDVLHCDNEILHLHLDSLSIPHDYIKIPNADHNLRLIL